MTSEKNVELKVGAHVLIQLGSELVTDVEQAILECVKNSYDADANGCSVEIDTSEVGEIVETAPAGYVRKFDGDTETVFVEMIDAKGHPILPITNIASDEQIERRLKYKGRITISDDGVGLTRDQLETSWLVISRSEKRTKQGTKKAKTSKGRTPLGDKGLGRLGSMKLGDILKVETSTSTDGPINVAQFRWADCEVAETIDEIPVFISELENPTKFKGTRVSVLGLNDLSEWQRKDKIHEITRSLASLVSPFETTSKFPVGITLDGVDQSLVTVTEEVLNQAVAEFTFEWSKCEETSEYSLIAKARLKKKLLTSDQGHADKARNRLVFGEDGGLKFLNFLKKHRRMKSFDGQSMEVDAPFLIELDQKLDWKDILSDVGADTLNPGSFDSAFYFFHLNKLDDSDNSAAAGIGIDRKLIKSMSGISILRDGFRIRSGGDWLGIAAGSTSGSSYGLRVENTLGYVELSGEHNFRLVEKSDREGFIEDAAFRGFLQIATRCRDFANEAMVFARRGLNEFYKEEQKKYPTSASAGNNDVLGVVSESIESANKAKKIADEATKELSNQIDRLGRQENNEDVSKAIKLAKSAATAISNVSATLSNNAYSTTALDGLKLDLEDRSEQSIALLESAAVGLSARGLAHELRTHLTEIRQQTKILEEYVSSSGALPHLRAIRSACSAISSSAALIDPMLPRSRLVKEDIILGNFINEYIENRKSDFERAGISMLAKGSGASVRMNRSRLLQVIDNLVRNSMYWLRRAERIGTIPGEKSIEVGLTSSGFQIMDTGSGVDPRYEDSLFDMFVTGKPDRSSGQGLGLFIVRELLAIDGCEIELLEKRNEQGRRYVFSIDLTPNLTKA